uniref:Uncharacterized protein n=1 Tax=viral metagenome TaxID=1070528 RepID=A0A6C0DJN8_9ZZZZ
MSTINLIDQISLDYLINKDLTTKIQSKNKTKQITRKEKKFYRKRVLNLTRELLTPKNENEDLVINPTLVDEDLLCAFNNYIKACIRNFKILDKNDIIQHDYKYLDEDMKINNHEGDNVSEYNETKILDDNKLFMRRIESKSNLDNFVKIKSLTKTEPLILPKLREIHLDDPILRNKGIQKKENINIVYAENTKKEDDKKEKK